MPQIRALLVTAFLIAAPSAFALPLHVDVRDLADSSVYDGSDRDDAANLVSALRRFPSRFFPRGVTFPANGARRYSTPVRAMRRVRLSSGRYARRNVVVRYRLNPSRDTLENSVYGVELEAQPRTTGEGHTEYTLIALVRQESGDEAGERFYFQRMTAVLNGSRVVSVTPTERIRLSDTSFSVRVGLFDRRLVVQDSANRITKVYPIDVGALDFGREHGEEALILTPLYQNATISSSRAIFDRDDPFYFQHMPFIRIMASDGSYHGIGFHVQMTRRLRRGFESHGCNRLRFKDLFELYYLLAGARGRRTMDVNFSYRLGSGYPDHPLQPQNYSYNRVMWPHEEDEYGLNALERINNEIRLRSLMPESRARALAMTLGEEGGRDAAAGDESGAEDLPGEDD